MDGMGPGPPPLGAPTVVVGLRSCDHDLDLAQSEAVASFGTAAFGVASLPDVHPGRPSTGQLHTAATLFYAMHLEAAGIPTFTERLAEQVSDGRLMLALEASSGHALGRYHRAARYRHTAAERRAIYSRLFGGPGAVDPHDGFASQFDQLTQLLGEAAHHTGNVPVHVRVRAAQAALVLGTALSGRAAGATRYDAERILADIRTSHALLKDPGLVHALGGGQPLAMIERNATLVMGKPIDTHAALTRGRAGAEVLRWVADYAVVSSAPPLRADDPVVSAAVSWRAMAA